MIKKITQKKIDKAFKSYDLRTKELDKKKQSLLNVIYKKRHMLDKEEAKIKSKIAILNKKNMARVNKEIKILQAFK